MNDLQKIHSAINSSKGGGNTSSKIVTFAKVADIKAAIEDGSILNWILKNNYPDGTMFSKISNCEFGSLDDEDAHMIEVDGGQFMLRHLSDETYAAFDMLGQYYEQQYPSQTPIFYINEINAKSSDFGKLLEFSGRKVCINNHNIVLTLNEHQDTIVDYSLLFAFEDNTDHINISESDAEKLVGVQVKKLFSAE